MARVRGALTGREKAAILLIALGKERASQIYKHLTEDEIEQLTLEIANLSRVDSDIKNQVIEEFYQLCLAQNYIAEGGIVYAREIQERALGSQKALEIINRLTSSLQVRPFDFVRKAEPSQILNFIQNEHPQTIALILAYLQPQQSAAIISSLPQEKQVDVATRIALMDRTSPDVIKEVERILEKKLSSMLTTDFTNDGGVHALDHLL